MKTIPVKTWHYELIEKKCTVVEPPCNGLTIMPVKKPTIDFYRFLYNTVGRNFSWFDRKLMNDSELKSIIHSENTYIFVLYKDGNPAGFAEFNYTSKEIELVYFGIMEEFHGMKLSNYFLSITINQMREYDHTRIWLHTCELDHPAAVYIYEKAGFVKFKEEIHQQKIEN